MKSAGSVRSLYSSGVSEPASCSPLAVTRNRRNPTLTSGFPVGDGAATKIGAGNLHAEVEQDLGDTAHADSADTDEVRVL